jgi:hypothetical protein
LLKLPCAYKSTTRKSTGNTNVHYQILDVSLARPLRIGLNWRHNSLPLTFDFFFVALLDVVDFKFASSVAWDPRNVEEKHVSMAN